LFISAFQLVFLTEKLKSKKKKKKQTMKIKTDFWSAEKQTSEEMN
jgi:hypothetical protein